MTLATINESAQQMGISADTVKRRLRSGHLVGHQQPTPQGFTWLIEMPDTAAPAIAPADAPPVNSDVHIIDDIVPVMQSQIQTLQDQVQLMGQQLDTKDHQISELLTVVRQAQAMLPAPKASRRHWWRLWRR